MTDTRTADYPIEPGFLERWSPRAFDGSTLSIEDLMPLFEAARWAPSSYNVQPWRFLYALRDTPDWQRFLDLLIPFNQDWAKTASALVIVVSDTQMGEGDQAKPSHSHSFDAGAAWAHLALQAHAQGLYTHGMTGVDFDKARSVLQVPERFRVEAAIAIGRIGDPAGLPEALRARETPSGRRPVNESVAAGNFAW